MLTGTEVKSLRAGHANLVDGYAHIRDGEVWLAGVHIPEYTEGTWTNHEPRRERKLLLHRARDRAADRQDQGGRRRPSSRSPCTSRTARPRSRSRWPAARSTYDKRQALAEKQSKREMQRALSRRSSGKDR